MKKSLFVIFAILTVHLNCHSKEPRNNLGKSLSIIKQEFPELRYIKTDSKGDMYEDGYPEEGIASFFYFKNGYVIEESMICQSIDDFSLDWYKSMANTFCKDYSSSLKENKPNVKRFVFPTFEIHIIFVEEHEKKTAMIVYTKTEENALKNNKNSTHINRNIMGFCLGITPRNVVAKNLKVKNIHYDDVKDIKTGELHILLRDFNYAGQTWDLFQLFFDKGKFVAVEMSKTKLDSTKSLKSTFLSIYDSLYNKYSNFYLLDFSDSLSKYFSDDQIMIGLNYDTSVNHLSFSYHCEQYLSSLNSIR